MAERSFEAELERSFAHAPHLRDADLFTAQVVARLDRGWGVRRILIGGLGLIGGLIGGLQLLRSGMLERLAGLTSPTHFLLSSEMARLPVARSLSEALASGASMDSEVLWMSAALGLLAAGLLVTRTLRDI